MSFLDGLKELGKSVSKYAPLIGDILPIPAGRIIGEIIADKFGGNIENPLELSKKIERNPEAAIILASIQSNYEIEINKIRLQYYSEENKDRNSARNREIVLKDWMPTFIAISFIIIYSVLQAYIIYVPGSGDDVISARLQDILVMIISYYFGSSSSSRKKDDVITSLRAL